MPTNRIARWLLIIAAIGALVEAGSAAAYWFLVAPSRAGFLIWNPNLEDARRNWIATAGAVDLELGGPIPVRPTAARRPNGAKENTEFPEGQPCASAYGDSYVWGYELQPGEGWVEQLSHRLGCRVENFAVNNFELSQNYLRFRQMKGDMSSIVLIGINSAAPQGVITQYGGFLGSPLTPQELKGRFILDEAGQLKRVPRPDLDANGFVELHRAPAKFLPHEYLLPDTRDGPITLRFPYTLTLLRVALMPRLHMRLTGRPSWSALYEKDNPSNALAVTVAIAEAFVHEAEQRGKRAILVMQPSLPSFRGRVGHAGFEYAPFISAMKERGIEVVDPGPAMIESLEGRSYCELFTRTENCVEGHYSRLGNALVAETVASELRRRGLLN